MLRPLDTAAVNFASVVIMLLSRGSFYALLQIGCRHWSSSGKCLRRTLTRSEWRTMIGMTAFAGLSDLVLVSADRFDFRDLFPMMVMHCVLYALGIVALWRQMGQIEFFRRKLALGHRQGVLGVENARSLETKRSTYNGFLAYHVGGLAMMAASIGWSLFAVLYLLWEYSNSVPLILYLISEQFIIQGLYLYWAIFNILGILQ